MRGDVSVGRRDELLESRERAVDWLLGRDALGGWRRRGRGDLHLRGCWRRGRRYLHNSNNSESAGVFGHSAASRQRSDARATAAV